MKKSFLAFLLGCVFVVSAVLPVYSDEIPSADIIVDGYTNDWEGLQPYAQDPSGDTVCGYGTDLKAVYFAKDSQHLYWRVDTHSGYIDPEYNPTILFLCR